MSLELIISTGIIAISYIIGKYQKKNGYSYTKAFIGALIGLTGLALLAYKAFG